VEVSERLSETGKIRLYASLVQEVAEAIWKLGPEQRKRARKQLDLEDPTKFCISEINIYKGKRL